MELICGTCGAALKIKTAVGGARFPCPKCGAKITVPKSMPGQDSTTKPEKTGAIEPQESELRGENAGRVESPVAPAAGAPASAEPAHPPAAAHMPGSTATGAKTETLPEPTTSTAATESRHESAAELARCRRELERTQKDLAALQQRFDEEKTRCNEMQNRLQSGGAHTDDSVSIAWFSMAGVRSLTAKDVIAEFRASMFGRHIRRSIYLHAVALLLLLFVAPHIHRPKFGKTARPEGQAASPGEEQRTSANESAAKAPGTSTAGQPATVSAESPRPAASISNGAPLTPPAETASQVKPDASARAGQQAPVAPPTSNEIPKASSVSLEDDLK
jgi:DNA-directed RNA polymerase subunit RPC12/RpoP